MMSKVQTFMSLYEKLISHQEFDKLCCDIQLSDPDDLDVPITPIHRALHDLDTFENYQLQEDCEFRIVIEDIGLLDTLHQFYCEFDNLFNGNQRIDLSTMKELELRGFNECFMSRLKNGQEIYAIVTPPVVVDRDQRIYLY